MPQEDMNTQVATSRTPGGNRQSRPEEKLEEISSGEPLERQVLRLLKEAHKLYEPGVNLRVFRSIDKTHQELAALGSQTIPFLRHVFLEDPSLCHIAGNVLGDFVPASQDIFLEGLDSDNPAIVNNAYAHVARLCLTKGEPARGNIAARLPVLSGELRRKAIFSLASGGCEEALINLLESPDVALRREALWGIALSRSTGRDAIFDLAYYSGDGEALVARRYREDVLARNVVETMKEFDPLLPSRAEKKGVWNSVELNYAMWTLGALAENHREDLAPFIARGFVQLFFEDPTVTGMTLWALSRCGKEGSAALPSLYQLARTAWTSKMQSAATGTIEDIYRDAIFSSEALRNIVTAVRKATETANFRIKAEGISELRKIGSSAGKIGENFAATALLAAASDTRWPIRFYANRALKCFQKAEAFEVFRIRKELQANFRKAFAQKAFLTLCSELGMER